MDELAPYQTGNGLKYLQRLDGIRRKILQHGVRKLSLKETHSNTVRHLHEVQKELSKYVSGSMR